MKKSCGYEIVEDPQSVLIKTRLEQILGRADAPVTWGLLTVSLALTVAGCFAQSVVHVHDAVNQKRRRGSLWQHGCPSFRPAPLGA